MNCKDVKASLKDFPFDKTTCQLDIASWLYDGELLTVSNATLVTGVYDSNLKDTAVEFDITTPRTRSDALAGSYESLASKWSLLLLEFEVRRNPHFYIINAVGPMWVVVFLASR